MRNLAVSLVVVILAACGASESQEGPAESSPPDTSASAGSVPERAGSVPAIAGSETCENFNEDGMALYGDVHVHTSLSFDAAANSTGADPYDANRYARGEPIPFFPIVDGKPQGQAQIDRPLDFLAVTDHGEFLGERALCSTPGSPVYADQYCQTYRSNQRLGMSMLAASIATEEPERIPAVCGEDGTRCPEFAREPWQLVQDAANESNEPCKFTSFVAYEYTGTPGTSNYHRNVIFRSDAVPNLPVSYIDAPYDSKLWVELDNVCKAEAGCDYLTIPHNTNLATGRMAPYKYLDDTLEAKRAYATKRQKREPIMEIFQHKGGSECVNGLSSVLGAPDELCDIENVRPLGREATFAVRAADGSFQLEGGSEFIRECEEDEVGNNGMLGAGCVHATDFQRSGLVVGLKEEQEIGVNPIKLGVIAASDTHSANPGNVAEEGWSGAVTGESTPAERLQRGLLTSGIDGNPGGLAGVWAKENTRDAIFDAMLRREVFGTSGPRISVRLFAGWDLPDDLCDASDQVSVAYRDGVPMGSDLKPGAGQPSFYASASQDPNGLPLNELHLIKGWVNADGTMETQVIPVQEAEKAATLCAVYKDEAFDPEVPSYYYLRAVEPATPRWHTYDCDTFAEADRPAVCSSGDYPGTIREMAWSSPIWYRPSS